MCGIVGYIGPRDVLPVLVGGLKKLEYRGYDSAGVAYIGKDGKMNVVKAKGRVSVMEARLGDRKAENTVGIGHTRWATHGEPSDVNAHPQTCTSGEIAVVHNGIIENYAKLKEWLIAKGITFVSETDTEVVAHLVNYYYEGDLRSAVMKAVERLDGSYALGIICVNEPNRIVAVKKDSPLIIGVGDGENMIASDVPAILNYTRNVYYLNDGEIAVIEREKVRVWDEYGNKVEKELNRVEWDAEQAEKAGYEHFMIKETLEQPKAIENTLLPRIKDGHIDLSDAGLTDEFMRDVKRIVIVACGTASHAGLAGKYYIEALARIPVDVDTGSEFRYRDPIFTEGEMLMTISQSGETADTIAAMREAKAAGLKVLTVTNVVGSTLARESDAVIYNRAGMEIAVASTKAYTNQLLVMLAIAMEAARVRKTITEERYAELLGELKKLPMNMEKVFALKEKVQKMASNRYMDENMYYIGRGLDYYVAMEGTMKIKEVSYIHAEPYSAGEMKHGPIALISDNTLVVAFVTQGKLVEKTLSNIKEVKSRGGYALAITQERYRDQVATEADTVWTIPDTDDLVAPMLSIIPFQMFGYYVAVMKGFDPDKPRNLAKSVTVE